MKAVFFDIDGTLRGFNLPIPPSARKALRQLQANGHKVFLNTGRPRCIVDDEIIQLAQPDGIVSGCGSQVYLGDELIYDHQLSHEESCRITLALRKNAVPSHLENPYWLYHDPLNSGNGGMKQMGMRLWFKGKYRELGEELPEDFCISKFVTESYDYDLLREICGTSLKVLEQPDHGAECVQFDCDKGTGIDVVAERLGISLDDCYAVGDSNNDLGMLTHVKHSIAMGSGMPEIFPHVEYVTTGLMQDGIYNAMKHYGLI